MSTQMYERAEITDRSDLILEALCQRHRKSEPLPARVTLHGEEIATRAFLLGHRTDHRESWPSLANLIETATAMPLVSEVALTVEGRATYRS
ncbi:hypothetical protein FNL56_21550 [Tardiphaga sp. vice304]|uniref:hypothetical protein n=1 Tax=Tardiphaga sp. vice304 TaxID=2592817 RepID=UPI0011629C1A|nr:hypothetical protein [Tardiphaga sp. vice304]QDM28409.1 hypothetical protein FNL56_21550 [Tardiphaga sp. vice304]